MIPTWDTYLHPTVKYVAFRDNASVFIIPIESTACWPLHFCDRSVGSLKGFDSTVYCRHPLDVTTWELLCRYALQMCEASRFEGIIIGSPLTKGDQLHQALDVFGFFLFGPNVFRSSWRTCHTSIIHTQVNEVSNIR